MGLFNFIKSKFSYNANKISEQKIISNEPEISKAFQFNKHELPEGIPLGDIILLWWANNRLASAKVPIYFVDKYQIKVSSEINSLMTKNFLRYSTPFESLHSFKVSEIKTILKEHGEKVSGKKSDLIDRIKLSIPESKIPSVESYKLTISGELLIKKYKNIIWGHLNSSSDGNINAFTFEQNLEVDPSALAISICENKFIDYLKMGNFGFARNSLHAISTYKDDSLNELLEVFCFDISGLQNSAKNYLYLSWYGVAPGIIKSIKNKIVQNEVSDVMLERMIKSRWEHCYTFFPCSIVNDSATATKLLFSSINEDFDSVNKIMESLYKKVPSKYKLNFE